MIPTRSPADLRTSQRQDQAQAQRSSTPRSSESYESQRIRDNAVEILQSYEKLSWLSFKRRESLAQTRLYFQKIVAGLDPDADGVRYVEDFSPHQVIDNNKVASEAEARGSKKGKGKERAVDHHHHQQAGGSSRQASSKEAREKGAASPSTSGSKRSRAIEIDEMDVD